MSLKKKKSHLVLSFELFKHFTHSNVKIKSERIRKIKPKMAYKEEQINVTVSNWLHVNITISNWLHREDNSNNFGHNILAVYP